MAKGPIKSTMAAKKARRVVETIPKTPTNRLAKKQAKKELKSAGANLRRSTDRMDKDIKGSTLQGYLKAGSRANNATRQAADAKVSSKAAIKAVGKGQKMVLKGEARRAKANAKDLKKVNKVSKKFGM